jgi:hypothetical protein
VIFKFGPTRIRSVKFHRISEKYAKFVNPDCMYAALSQACNRSAREEEERVSTLYTAPWHGSHRRGDSVGFACKSVLGESNSGSPSARSVRACACMSRRLREQLCWVMPRHVARKRHILRRWIILGPDGGDTGLYIVSLLLAGRFALLTYPP